MALIDNLISYWKLDESSGNAIDVHGDNDGTIVVATQGAGGIINTAYDFDGTNDEVVVPDTANLRITGDLTYSVWVYLGDFNANTIISKAESPGNWAGVGLIHIHNPSGVETLYFRRGNSVNDEDALIWTGLDEISLNTWTHIVVTADGTTWKMYVNGDEKATGTKTVTVADSGNDLHFGLSPNSDNDFLGRIDEIGIWNRALGPTEVTELYNSGNGLAYPFTAVGTNTQINIDDNWKSIASMKINIDDDWKEVASAKINVDDDWKTIF